MKDRLIGKGLVLVVAVLLVGTSVIPIINGNTVETNFINNDSEYQTRSSIINENVLDLDLQFIYNITENLSNIIFTEYNESAGELAQGRAFGSKGELKAAEIIYENMTMLGLYTTKERINNTPTLSPVPNIASRIEILERGLIVHEVDSDVSKNSNITVTNCYISPKWDLTGLQTFLNDALRDKKYKSPIIGFIFEKLIHLLLPHQNGVLDRKYNFYDTERLNYNFSYKNLKIVRKPTDYSMVLDLKRRFENDEPFVYIDKQREFSLWPKQNITFRGFIYKYIFEGVLGKNQNLLWALLYPNCKGVIYYDSCNETFNTVAMDYTPLPIIYVNRTIGEKIDSNPENYRIDFYINQSYNESAESYNVIGLLNGTNTNETVIISGFHDSCWCQGTADAAIGVSIVLGIAKYMKDNNIKPKCNVKFISFCGEEGSFRGAYFYEAIHRDENITTFIDVNQVGFDQPNPKSDPKLTFEIMVNNESISETLREISKVINYAERTGNTTDFKIEVNEKSCGPSDVKAFAWANFYDKRSCNTLLFVKDTSWILHHHDGVNHREGDVLKYFNHTDVNLTFEMIWNITKYFILSPDCWFENESFAAIDSPDDEDDKNDSIKMTFTIKTTLPSDQVMVNASLTKSERVVANKIVNYTVTPADNQYSITLTVPQHEEPGCYKCTLYLYNSTGRINEILHLKNHNVNDISPEPPEIIYYYLYPYWRVST